MTVEELGRVMTAKELDEWALYFEENPSEKTLSGRLELSIARLTSGMCGGAVTDHLQLSDKQRFEIESVDIEKALNGN